MKKFLLSGVGVVAFAFTFAIAAPNDAQAQKGSLLKPATPWSVKKVDGRVGSYCTMAKRFEYNTILTVAQNANAESTIAIDFQRPILKSGKTLSVTLDAGSGAVRAFEVSPISNQAFVAKLGHDSAFFTALKQTGMLRIAVGQQNYNFNLADIDDGRFQLNKCVTALPPMMPKASVPVVAESQDIEAASPAAIVSAERAGQAQTSTATQGELTPPPRAEVLAAVREEQRLQRELERERENAQSSQELAALEARNTQLQQELKAVYAQKKNEAAQAGLSAEDYKRQIQEIEAAQRATLHGLQAELVALREEMAAREQELASVKQENAALRERAQIAVQAQADLAGLQVEIERLAGENTGLVNQLAAVKQGVDADQVTLNALKAENEGLKQALVEKEQRIAMLEARQNELVASGDVEAQLQTLDRKYMEQLSAKERELQKLSAQNAELRQELDHVGLMRNAEEEALFGDVASSAGVAPMVLDRSAPVEALMDEADVVATEPVMQAAAQSMPQQSATPTRYDNAVLEDPEVAALNDAQRQELMIKQHISKPVEVAPQQERVVETIIWNEPPVDIAPSAGDDEAAVAQPAADPFEEVLVENLSADTLDDERDEVEVASLDDNFPAAPAMPEEVLEARGESKSGNDVASSVRASSSGYYTPGYVIAGALPASARVVEAASGAEQVVYQWNAGEVYGSAEQKPIADSYQFDTLVQRYLEKTEARCEGDFAIVPDGSVEQGGMRVDRYDVACVSSNISSSAALLFFNRGDTFTVLAHEAPADMLGAAIDEREALLGAVVRGS